VSLTVAVFFVVFRAASSICISFLYIKLGGLPGAGKVHLKCSNEKQSQLRQSAAKTSSHVHVEPSALVWQIIENILVETQSRPAWVISTCCNCLPSTRNFSFQYIPLGRTRAEFSSQSLWCSIYHVHEICSNFHATPRNLEKRPSLHVYAFSKVFKCVGLKDSFMIIKWNISLWLDWEQHGRVKQHDVASPAMPSTI